MDQTKRDESGQPSDAPPAGDPATPSPTRRPADPPVPNSSALAGMGIQFLVAVLLCLFGGKWLDARFGTAPFLMLLGVLLGAGVSIWSMYRKVFPGER